MKILFIVPYPIGESPSQRFRFEQYFKILSESGAEFQVNTFLNSDNWRVFYNEGNNFLKLKALLIGLINRTRSIATISKFDFVFIHREAVPIGPPIFEWIIAKLFKKKIIYDFDDAIWLTDKKNESWLERTIRWRSKVKSICRWSYRISAGNDYLKNYAQTFNINAVKNPTTIDTENVHKHVEKISGNDKITIGWTGSHSTLKYLKELEQTLLRVEKKFSHIDFCVIADKAPDLKLNRLLFKPWSLKTEVSDLAQFDIGIMPLPNDEWTKGKCGFKALQYMSMEIPTIASDIGENKIIIKHGVNGFLATDSSEWETYLTQLIENESLRKQLGREGKKTVDNQYSVAANSRNFLSLFNLS
jgi:glycosyltransferase involved in cell wall biosynthesis